MPKPVFGQFYRPGGIAQLTRGRGWNSELVGFLLPYAFRDYWFKLYDFDEEDEINARFAVANSSGTSAADFAPVVDAEDGLIEGDTGTTDNGSVGLGYDNALMDAAREPGAEIRFLSDAITNSYIEFALCDPPTNLYAINFDDIDTPSQASNGVTDIVAIVMDTDQTLKSPALVSVGTTDTTVTKSVMGASPGANPFTAATFATLLIQAYANKSYGILDDNLATAGRLAIGMDTAILVRPQFVYATRTTTARFPRVDYVAMWKERKGT